MTIELIIKNYSLFIYVTCKDLWLNIVQTHDNKETF